jgi:hypothetical protein
MVAMQPGAPSQFDIWALMTSVGVVAVTVGGVLVKLSNCPLLAAKFPRPVILVATNAESGAVLENLIAKALRRLWKDRYEFGPLSETPCGR